MRQSVTMPQNDSEESLFLPSGFAWGWGWGVPHKGEITSLKWNESRAMHF